ncbi:MAG: hypothetical protein P8P74_10105 [Crocinitomicaceae bacterium]|nr:hypothetical protein [Crocinitomicaceae bacterium]
MSKKAALWIMFVLLGAVLVFHFLILTEIIPFDQVWAGRLKSVEEMRQFESFSILMNVVMLSVFIIKYRLLIKDKRNRVIDILIWIFAGFFALNTLGNLFAQSTLELILGTALTLISAVLCVVIAKK